MTDARSRNLRSLAGYPLHHGRKRF
jgi:hypothetical protein